MLHLNPSLIRQSDVIVIIVSTLFFTHFLLFIKQYCSRKCSIKTPEWRGIIDYVFLGISFLVILFSTRKSTKKSIKAGLWLSGFLQLMIILFESTIVENTFENIILVPAGILILFHYYNKKHCTVILNHSSKCSIECCQ